MIKMRGIVWYKKDLRVSDHQALYTACQDCQDGVIAVYLIDKAMWKDHAVSHHQIQFIINNLKILSQQLAELNIQLVIQQVSSTTEIPRTLHTLCEVYHVQKVYFQVEYEVNERKRDSLVVNYLQSYAIQCKQFEDQLILPYQAIKTHQGEYFKVFTAFKKKWYEVYYTTNLRCLPKPTACLPIISVGESKLPILDEFTSHLNFSDWPAGEEAAKKRLINFVNGPIYNYHQARDYPAQDATSKLSAYLAIGVLSVRTCFQEALFANNNELDAGNKGVITWINELIWREFYRHILIAVPRVCMNKPYKTSTEQIPWVNDHVLLSAWQNGSTGFPIVDAAMRQLNQTGWMHNRLRMITAMFLSKNLLIDWRLGERYFSENLIDCDFASNNGGWQWCASTGTDAVPYFRLFNPLTQSQRFDQEGSFIRTFCPELAHLDSKTIHAPYQLIKGLSQLNYPKPVIDYKASRQRVLEVFKARIG